MNVKDLVVKNFHRDDPLHITLLWWLLFFTLLLCLWAFYTTLPSSDLNYETVYVIGIIGLWRYSWKFIHLIRGLYYQYIRYPILSSLAELSHKPSEILLVIPCYQTTPEVSTPVFKALIDEIGNFGVACRVVACITDEADLNIIEVQFNKLQQQVPVSLFIIDQDGSGKRNTMADALTLLADDRPVSKDSILILMDGDTILPLGILTKVSGFLMRYHDLGALTVHNKPVVKGNSLTRQWYRQRMSQRHFYMSSLSLTYRVLVLTGRFSAFRASLALSPDFIESLRKDTITHWRYGRILMLTGDDKSTWFYILKEQWKMLYLPNISVTCLEDTPSGSFISTSISLMTRWYGNMLRSNIRAIQLGPKKAGWFLWLCLIDQRISMWTTLIGPSLALVVTTYLGVKVVIAYIFWVVLTRSLNVGLIAVQSGQFHPIFVVLLWYEQFIGSLVKMYLFFHPNLQRWTRQNIDIKNKDRSVSHEIKRWLPHIETIAAFSSLLIFVLWLYS
ncbi:glycosyltransferase [Candidatus Enterovibrio escicola]|uniref:glycosyltransferase n=1 Tax=Candidatus Enterovibrio escicola TaxID=1927127 RepID=UPI0012381829|nr:glycosyltransferase [Candidatus Enterovibrio escacola]